MSEDEAYVRDMFCMQLGAEDHPDVKFLLEEKVARNLLRPESRRRREAIAATMQSDVVEVEPDIYVHGPPSFQIDIPAFERVMGKIARGLYFVHMGQRMPDDYGVYVAPRLPPESVEPFRARMAIYGPSPVYELGPHKAVCYQYASKKPNPLGNNWLVTFYGLWTFAVHTGPQTGIEAMRKLEASRM